MAKPTKTTWRPVPRRTLAVSLSLLLLAASLLKLWAWTRFPQPSRHSWIESPSVSEGGAICEAALAVVLLAGLWPRLAWLAAVSTFTLFAIVTAIEAIQGKTSCGCFGAVQVKPVYTMCVDLAAVAALILTGKPDVGESEVGGWRSGRGQRILAGVIGVASLAVVGAMWLTKPAVAVMTTSIAGQEFGKAGELVVLEPEKWAGERFSLADHILADHIDVSSQLNSGRWIILLVHHDCDHCAAAVPKYIAAEERQNAEGRRQNEDGEPRLAVIEMSPFADPADPPPWQLPSTVLSGHLDETRDWFATTPVVIEVKDGVVISAKEAAAAESPDPKWFKP
jgi:hypothetical protein